MALQAFLAWLELASCSALAAPKLTLTPIFLRRFIVDVISVLPLEFWFHGAAGLLGMAKIGRAFKIGKVLRMMKLYRLLQIIRVPKLAELIEMYFDRDVITVRAGRTTCCDVVLDQRVCMRKL